MRMRDVGGGAGHQAKALAHQGTSDLARRQAYAKAGATSAGGYLFHYKALTKVFRAKVLDAIEQGRRILR